MLIEVVPIFFVLYCENIHWLIFLHISTYIQMLSYCLFLYSVPSFHVKKRFSIRSYVCNYILKTSNIYYSFCIAWKDLILLKNFYFEMYIDCSKRVCNIKWRINIYVQHHNKLIIYYKSTCNIIINNSLIIYAIHCNYISIIDTWSISFIIRNFFYDITSNYM